MAITNNFIQKWIKKVPNIVSQLEEKVNKEQGKGLSTNDYTNIEKEAVSTIKNKASEEELRLLVERMNQFTSLPEGSTTGDAELRDGRIGENKVSYKNIGSAIREQLRTIKEFSFPNDYLDFNGRGNQITVGDKIITTTSDSVKVTESAESTSGNSGFDIQLNENVKKISFDIEHINFGAICGIYYFKEDSLKYLYKKIEQPLSSILSSKNGIIFDVDWESVKNTMSSNGCDNLRFVIWNQVGAIKNGYCIAKNIRINNFKNISDINSYIETNEKDKKAYAKRDELYISSIRSLNKEVAKTSELIDWFGSNFKYNAETDEISYSYSNISGNNGFKTPPFYSYGRSILIIGKITNLSGSGGLSINLCGRKKSDSTTVYYPIGVVNKLGDFELKVDVKDLFSKKGELYLNDLSIVFGNSGIVDLKVKNIKVIESDNLGKTTLDELLNNITNYENIKNPNIVISDYNSVQPWGNGGELSVEGDIINFSHNSETGNSGFMTQQFDNTSGFVNVKGNVTDITLYNDLSCMQLYVIGEDNKGLSKYFTVGKITKTGEFDISIDLNSLVVYNGLNLNSPIQILFGSANKVDIVVKGYTVYKKKIPQSYFIEDNLKDTLVNFDNEIIKLNSEIKQIESNKNDSILTSPSGKRYKLSVDNNGEIITIPIIPRKVLFIGNSLLLGYGTFGMCASDSKNDFYYHVKEYLKAVNPSVICDRQHGAAYEQSENQQSLDTYINTYIKTKDTDYDLVIIQLGDNVNNDARNELFKTSCKYLLQVIRSHMPKARVVWVGEWYYTQQKQQVISNSCKETGCEFIDISDLNITENQGKIGDTITADDGSQSTIVSTGVASHPGNKGMKAIADRLIEKLFV